MSTVKKYDVGEINFDPHIQIFDDEIPAFSYTHELPLFSISDIQHSIDLTLVFNYKRYREEKSNYKNPHFIAPGYKLNLQKHLICNYYGLLTSLEESDGKYVELKAFGNTFTFDDDSHRILRTTEVPNKPFPTPGSDAYDDEPIYNYTVEYPDGSKEEYGSHGRITASYDKYNNMIASYTYNGYGYLTSITFGDSKVISLEYESSRVKYITYNSKRFEFCYNSDGMLDCIKQEFCGVKYQFSLSTANVSTDLNLQASDFLVKATPIQNDSTVLLSKAFVLCDDKRTLKIIDKIGYNIVNEVSYRSRTNLLNYDFFCDYMDVIDNNGVQIRTQFDNDNKAIYSYELHENQPRFDGENAQDRFSGNITLYNTTGSSKNNKAAGVQTRHDGLIMNYYNNQWSSSINTITDYNGSYILSGWIKSDDMTAMLGIGTFSLNFIQIEVPTIPGEWTYFSILLDWEANDLYLRPLVHSIDTRDVRIMFAGTNDTSHAGVYKYVLSNGNNEIPLNDAKFYYTTNGNNIEIQSDDSSTKTLTYYDVLMFKLRKKRSGISNEVYYNDCKDIIAGVTDLKLLYNGSCVSISNFDLGVRSYFKGKELFTKIVIDENTPNSGIVKTYTLDGTILLTEMLNNNLDVTSSTVDGVTTTYARNSQGQITSEAVNGLYTRTTIYDTNVANEPTITTTDEFNNSTVYTLDTVWGVIKSVNLPNNTFITDTYDDDMVVLTKRAFDITSTRQNSLGYSNGRFAAVANNALNYSFGYTADTGELASVSKNNANIEHHTYVRSGGETTVESKYPSSSNALHTETAVFDKYGRLKSVSGVFENSYDLDPYWVYYEPAYTHHTDIKDYDRVRHGDLSHITTNFDCKDAKLAQTTDNLTGEVTSYGYKDGKLTAAVTRRGSNDSVLRQETCVYDDNNRLTKDRFDYNITTGEYVTSHIEYQTFETDPLADERVKIYSYDINGTEKANTENTYDPYKRITNKKYRVGGTQFTKSIVYYKTQISTVTDSVGGTTLYEYDYLGRLSKEKDENETVIKSYEYDTYGQLVRENNQPLDKTFVYEYNDIGNVTSVKTYSYTIGALGSVTSQQYFSYDETYPDRLTNFGGASISYNAMGCPMSVNGYSASWTRGKLSKLTKGNRISGTHNHYYDYNAFGQRINKSYTYSLGTANSSSVAVGTLLSSSKSFCYDNSGRLIRESMSCEYQSELGSSDSIVYLYDVNSIIGMVYTSETGTTATYYFQRNLLGDVIGIYNTSGTKVGGYAYDAWGNCTITLNTNGIATRNPIRYRGYYYDEDTKLYYLNARYYCPEWRRFISPDDTSYLDPKNVNGLNLYAYCLNNPVNYYDPYGNSVSAIILILISTTLIGGITAGALSYNKGYRGWGVVKNIILGAGIGLAAGGVIVATGAVSAGAIAAISSTRTATFLGVSVLQAFAIGALAFNTFAYVIAPLYGVLDMQGVEYEAITPYSPPLYNPKHNTKHPSAK